MLWSLLSCHLVAGEQLVAYVPAVGPGVVVQPAQQGPALMPPRPFPRTHSQVDPACLGQLGLGSAVLTRSRANGFLKWVPRPECLGLTTSRARAVWVGVLPVPLPEPVLGVCMGGRLRVCRGWLSAPPMRRRRPPVRTQYAGGDEEAGAHAGGRPAALPLPAHHRRRHLGAGRFRRGTGKQRTCSMQRAGASMASATRQRRAAPSAAAGASDATSTARARPSPPAHPGRGAAGPALHAAHCRPLLPGPPARGGRALKPPSGPRGGPLSPPPISTPTPAHSLPPTAPPQNKFLQPDPAVVDALVEQLSAKRVGVVAHFYMDPEVQGVLSSAGEARAAARSARAGPGHGPAPHLACTAWRLGRRRGRGPRMVGLVHAACIPHTARFVPSGATSVNTACPPTPRSRALAAY